MSFADLCEMRRYYSENEDPFRAEVLRRIDHLATLFYHGNNLNISLQNTHTIITNQELSMQQKYQQLRQLGLNITQQNADDYITYLSFYFEKYPIPSGTNTVGKYLRDQHIS